MPKYRLFQNVYYSKVIDCVVEADSEDEVIQRARDDEFDCELHEDMSDPVIDEVSFDVELIED